MGLFTLFGFTVKGVDYSNSKQGTPYAIINLENLARGEYVTILDFELVKLGDKRVTSLLEGKCYNITVEFKKEYNYILLRWYQEIKF